MGLKPRDTVCLMMENCPEFIFALLGFAKIGVTCALLNYNLRDKALEHCISIVNPAAVFAQEKFCSEIGDILPGLRQKFPKLLVFSLIEFGTSAFTFVKESVSQGSLHKFSTNPPPVCLFVYPRTN